MPNLAKIWHLEIQPSAGWKLVEKGQEQRFWREMLHQIKTKKPNATLTT